MSDKVTISSIKIQTKEQEFVVSLGEAKQIWEELNKLFTEPKPPKVTREANKKKEMDNPEHPLDSFPWVLPQDKAPFPFIPSKIPWDEDYKPSPKPWDWTCISKLSNEVKLSVK